MRLQASASFHCNLNSTGAALSPDQTANTYLYMADDNAHAHNTKVILYRPTQNHVACTSRSQEGAGCINPAGTNPAFGHDY